jgi:putative toxin-antitoxin system antitoxin component (TIGR02293 family)
MPFNCYAYGGASKMKQRPIFDLYHIEQGIPAIQARGLEPYGLTRDDIRTIIPDRTLERRISAQQNLTLEEADGIARLLRVVQAARRVFENDDRADYWLRHPIPALDGAIPIRLARTDVGGRAVEQVLGRLEYGIFS